ncbi:MAG TPA: glycosyltransferase family 87 protein [Candidatus Eisenbacteria bacterium]|nr:glycosyltransferase family 87 protein [Candidatus Eisenbacteria bacterium]
MMLQFWVFWGARGRVLSGWPDFSIFYAAGVTIRRGQGAVLYNDAVQRQVQQEFIPETLAVRNPLPYNHPPFEVLLYLPLTYTNYVHAYMIWFLANVTLLGGCVYMLRNWLSALTMAFPWFMFAMPLAFFPVADSLLQGQDSIVLLALYCLAYVAFLRKKEMWAGVFLGLGLFKFHLVLPFVFLLFLKRRWRSLAGILISASVEALVSLVMVGWKELLHYPFYVWQINRKQPPGIIVPETMPNLRGLIMGWGSSSAALQLVVFVLSLLLLVWAAKRFAPEGLTKSDAWNAGFSVALIATFLVGYHSYAHDMTITLLPCLITFDRLLEQPPPRRAILLLFLLGVLFSPLFLYMTLYFAHQKLFALVLLLLVWAIASSVELPASLGNAAKEKRIQSFAGSCL